MRMAVCFAAVCGSSAVYAEQATENINLQKNQALAQALFKDSANLPLSFQYGERTYRGIPAAWNPQVSQNIADSRTLRTDFSGRDPQTGLIVTVEAVRYRDHPVMEWVVWFRNTSGQNLPVLRNVQAADLMFPMDGKQDAALWSGIAERHDDLNYSYKTEMLPRDAERSFEPSGGRACDNAFPYFRLSDEQGGYTVAVGWPGQWKATFKAVEGGVRLDAGQQVLAVSLRPGERIRTPRMTVVSYGAGADAANVWRRWFRDHALPREADGSALRPRVCGYAKRGEDLEHCKEGEATQIAFAKLITEKGFKFDTWWIDAGWYPCIENGNDLNWWFTGEWRPDPARFPNGMKPLSDVLAGYGTGLLLWFEPERIFKRNKPTDFDDKPAAWRLGPDGENALLNLANPEAVDYISKYMSAFIKEHGISVYRQDFNISPWGFWTREDERQGPDRVGITENLYIQGYLRYWDYLLADNPGLWIDSCSSGGRRNDMETMRRAVPLHYSDFGYERMVDKQRYMHMLYEWFMYFKEYASFNDKEADPFSIAVLSPFFVTAVSHPDDYDFANDKLFHEIWAVMKPYFVDGDYYLLTDEMKINAASWTVRQFHSPARDSGVVQCVRNEQNEDAVFVAVPKGIRPERTYTVTDLKTKAKQTLTGEAILRDGIRVELPPRTATVLHYSGSGM